MHACMHASYACTHTANAHAQSDAHMQRSSRLQSQSVQWLPRLPSLGQLVRTGVKGHGATQSHLSSSGAAKGASQSSTAMLPASVATGCATVGTAGPVSDSARTTSCAAMSPHQGLLEVAIKPCMNSSSHLNLRIFHQLGITNAAICFKRVMFFCFLFVSSLQNPCFYIYFYFHLFV